MDAAYTNAYANLYRHHWWWRVRERILVDSIRAMIGPRVHDTRILDIGCGAGLFFDALQQFGQVDGIEADPIAVAQSGRWRSRIHFGEIATFSPDRPYDLILVLDVLEHLAAPDQLLHHAVRLLVRGGRMLITVPAFDWLWTSHDDLNHHVKRYTRGELQCLVRSAGMTTIETRYLFQSLVLPKLMLRAVEALTSRDGRLPRVPPPTLNRALEAWFRSEYALAGSLPFGSSVLAIASAPE